MRGWVLSIAVVLASAAWASPLDDLDRGHRILIENGFQIQALALNTEGLDLARWSESNFTTVNFWATPNPSFLGPAPGIPWARWFGGGPISPGITLSADELPYYDTLVSIQAGDEQNLGDPAVVQIAADTFAFWRAEYPDLLHVLSQVSTHMTTVAPVMDDLRPDILVSGVYTVNDFDSLLAPPVARGGSQQKMYTRFQAVRETALAGHGGTDGDPLPFGYYTQTFTQPGHNDYGPMISESQMRLNHMAALAFGAKWLCAFIYNRVPDDENMPYFPIGFGADESETTTRFYQQSQLNAEILNLGPALLRLQTTDVRVARGEHVEPLCVALGGTPESCVEPIPLPNGVEAWNISADPYIESITATNLSGANDGFAGDVLVGYFEPLSEAFDGPGHAGETYFMLVNSMAYPDRDSSEVRQRIHVTFDFGGSGITGLQRLSRFTGQVEPVVLEPLGGSRYRLTLEYGGGEGDLYKFDNGAPFIVADEPAPAPPVTVALVPDSPTIFLPRGSTLRLEALVSGAAGSVSYAWFRDLGPDIPDSALQVKAAASIGADAAVLEMEDMAFEDAGAYWVAVTVGGETYYSPVAQVVVGAAVPLGGRPGLALLTGSLLLLGFGGVVAGARRKARTPAWKPPGRAH